MTMRQPVRPPKPTRFDRYQPTETIICGTTVFVVPDWIANGYPRVWSAVQGNMDRAAKWERACLEVAAMLARVRADVQVSPKEEDNG
jgi:hypothetical protein